jgi:hypothetical protein
MYHTFLRAAVNQNPGLPYEYQFAAGEAKSQRPVKLRLEPVYSTPVRAKCTM